MPTYAEVHSSLAEATQSQLIQVQLSCEDRSDLLLYYKLQIIQVETALWAVMID